MPPPGPGAVTPDPPTVAPDVVAPAVAPPAVALPPIIEPPAGAPPVRAPPTVAPPAVAPLPDVAPPLIAPPPAPLVDPAVAPPLIAPPGPGGLVVDDPLVEPDDTPLVPAVPAVPPAVTSLVIPLSEPEGDGDATTEGVVEPLVVVPLSVEASLDLQPAQNKVVAAAIAEIAYNAGRRRLVIIKCLSSKKYRQN